MIRNLLTLVAFGGAVALVACSDDAGEKYPDTESFCAAKAKEECAGVAASCATSEEACAAARKPACLQAAGQATGEARNYKAAVAENCLGKTHDLYAAKVPDATKEEEQTDACERVFAGDKKAAEACQSTYECEGALICDKGFCAEKVLREIDKPCTDSGAVCVDDAYCADRGGGQKFCSPKKSKGDICTPDVPCKDDLRCTGTCVDKVGPGGDCTADADCGTAAPYCEPKMKRCQLKYQAGTAACKEFGGS